MNENRNIWRFFPLWLKETIYGRYVKQFKIPEELTSNDERVLNFKATSGVTLSFHGQSWSVVFIVYHGQ